MDKAMKRINFFKGFATTAQDWQAAEAYHIEKRKLHNQYFHAPGVILECLKGLAVMAIKEGSALRVEPGMALDGEGRELYLPQPIDLDVNLRQYRGTTIYVAIEYGEQPVEHRPNKFNSDYEGHAFIEELPAVTIARDQPDNKLKLELARVDLTPEVTSIKDPADSSWPGRNEIDRRFIRKTGRFQAHLEDVADVVSAGTTTVSGNGTTLILIQHDQPLGVEHCYVPSVSPVELKSDVDVLRRGHENQGVSWKILLRWKENNQIAYQLEIANSSPVDMLVAYKVYRFR
ncbi:MAG: hypothetical protein NTNFB02_23370 [Nitrospira sp.]